MPGMRRRALLPRRPVRRALLRCLPASILPCTLACTLPCCTLPSCTSPGRGDRASRERDAQPLLLALRKDDLVVERLVERRGQGEGEGEGEG